MIYQNRKFILFLCFISLTCFVSCIDESATILTCSEETATVTQVGKLAEKQNPLFPIIQNRKWGFIDQIGKVVIQATFDEVREFSENRAAFRIGNKWGFIDIEGNIIVEAQFDRVIDFIDQRASFKKDELWGLIDTDGRIIVASEEFDFIAPRHGQRFIFVKENKRGLMDADGRIVAAPDFSQIGKFSEGLASFELKNNSEIKVGFIDPEGQIIFELRGDLGFSPWGYVDTSSFKNGLVPVYALNPGWSFLTDAVLQGRSRYLWGYIDRRGRVVIPLKYDSASNFSECLAEVKIGQKSGFINLSGKMVIEPTFSGFVSSFSEGLAEVKIDEKSGYIDRTGKIVIPPQFEEGGSFFDGLASVKIQDKWGAIDRTGQIVIEPQFKRHFIFNGQLAQVETEDGWGYIDRAGKYVWKQTKQ